MNDDKNQTNTVKCFSAKMIFIQEMYARTHLRDRSIDSPRIAFIVGDMLVVGDLANGLPADYTSRSPEVVASDINPSALFSEGLYESNEAIMSILRESNGEDAVVDDLTVLILSDVSMHSISEPRVITNLTELTLFVEHVAGVFPVSAKTYPRLFSKKNPESQSVQIE